MAKTLRDETKADRKKVKEQLRAAGALGEPGRLFEPRGKWTDPAEVQAAWDAKTSNAQIQRELGL